MLWALEWFACLIANLRHGETVSGPFIDRKQDVWKKWNSVYVHYLQFENGISEYRKQIAENDWKVNNI